VSHKHSFEADCWLYARLSYLFLFFWNKLSIFKILTQISRTRATQSNSNVAVDAKTVTVNSRTAVAFKSFLSTPKSSLWNKCNECVCGGGGATDYPGRKPCHTHTHNTHKHTYTHIHTHTGEILMLVSRRTVRIDLQTGESRDRPRHGWILNPHINHGESKNSWERERERERARERERERDGENRVLMGDFNARVGRAKTRDEEWTLGKYGEVWSGEMDTLGEI
jgi:hypothetical protein